MIMLHHSKIKNMECVKIQVIDWFGWLIQMNRPQTGNLIVRD
jgi:hypothetical protein